ncbi:MAG: BON domain-containing protein [Nitrospiria bacterium]
MKQIPLLLFILALAFPPTVMAKESGDLWIKTSLENMIEKDGHLDLSDIWIRCENGLVTIAGIVRTNEEKGMATELTIVIPGVTKLENLLTVEPASDADSNLEKKIREIIDGNSLLHVRKLGVRARNGKVTIWGIVHHLNEKMLTSELLFNQSGTKRVVNNIEVLE